MVAFIGEGDPDGMAQHELERRVADEAEAIFRDYEAQAIRAIRDRFELSAPHGFPTRSIQHAATAVVEAELRGWAYGELVFAVRLQVRRNRARGGTA
ncbi:MAG: hypothetical protein L3J92_05100 [Thermoplasmata archaeon]|nr:hypothetical protein [Thermoplasmata archaeon]